MRLTYNGTVVELATRHDYPYQHVTTKMQTSAYSGMGRKHVESYVVKTGKYIFVFSLMPTADYQKLLNFFLNLADGIKNEFVLQDDLGVSRTVRFTEPELNFKQDFYGLWSGRFTVEEVL